MAVMLSAGSNLPLLGALVVNQVFSQVAKRKQLPHTFIIVVVVVVMVVVVLAVVVVVVGDSVASGGYKSSNRAS